MKIEEKIAEERKKAWNEADILIENFANEESKSKYGNKKLRVGGVLYDSHKEYYRHLELMILQKYGVVSHVKFHEKSDKLLIVKNPNVFYIPDFTYYDKNGEKIVEDVKGMQTPEFILKKKIVVSKIRTKEYNFTFLLTRKYQDGFRAFESYSFSKTYIQPKRKRKKKM